MKILQMIDTYYPTVDGAISVAKNYTENLNRAAECDLATAKAARADRYSDRENFRVLRCASLPAPEKYRNALPGWDAKFKRLIREGHYDILHCHSPFNMGRFAVSMGKQLHVPVVLTLHTKYYEDFIRVTGNRMLSEMMVRRIRHAYNEADSVWTVSYASCQTLRDYGYTGTIEVVRNGTDFVYPANAEELISRVNALHQLEGRRNVFFFVGRMAMYKNLRLLADALAAVKSRGKDFTMLFVGGGFDLEEFRKYVSSLGLDDRCIFTGHVADRQLLQGYYLRGDLMLFPSTFDMASIAKVEAAAHEKPSLVIRDSCSAEEVVDNDNGFLCEENTESLAERICELCDAPEQLKKAGERAKETLYRTWDHVAAEVLEKYRAIIDTYGKKE